MKKIKAGICGATGYTGIELIRLLNRHPMVEISFLTSESHSGKKIGEVIPEFNFNPKEIFFSSYDDSLLDMADVVFLALPHEPAAELGAKFFKNGIKVIDLSAAYRFKDLSLFESVYKFHHPEGDVNNQAQYGLCEVYKDKIKQSSLIANPGCYPTSVLLPLIPLFQKGIIQGSTIICDSKSGFSGRGKKVDQAGLFCEMNENFYAYSIGNHRHKPEIEQELSFANQNNSVRVIFTPHVIPLDRGILSTIYITNHSTAKEEVEGVLKGFYEKAPFVRILDQLPQIKWVNHTNNCLIHITADNSTNTIIIVSVIDNLLKGASGQAVQNMNLLCGFEETMGLI